MATAGPPGSKSAVNIYQINKKAGLLNQVTPLFISMVLNQSFFPITTFK
jgi:hypothetical protein